MEGKLFRRVGLWTIIAVYFLILVGGIVRATGSGMGCPDWPKCFGSWVPPTDVSQLPSNYKEVFGAKLKGEVEFNALKTWTEYVNRLVGVTIGLLIFATAVIAFITFWKKDRVIVWITFLAFLSVGFEGWLGAVVVSTELHPIVITVHMLLAIVIVFMLIYAIARSYNEVLKIEKIKDATSISFITIAVLVLTFGQTLLGTQVREMVDEVALRLGDSYRSQWIDNLGGKFIVHQIFGYLVFGLHFFLYLKIRTSVSERSIFRYFTNLLVAFILIEVLSGIIIAFLNIPAFAQPIHLTMATLCLGVQFVMILLLNKEKVFKNIYTA